MKINIKILSICFIFFFLFLSNSVYSEEVISEKYTFHVYSILVTLDKPGEEIKTQNLIHPIIIQEDRSMLDIRFFSGIGFSGTSWSVDTHGDYKYTLWLKLYVPETKDEMIIQMDFTYYPKSNTGVCITRNTGWFNNKEIIFPIMPIYKGNQAPYCSSNDLTTHYLLPLRFVFETFGYTVEWNNETREITAYK